MDIEKLISKLQEFNKKTYNHCHNTMEEAKKLARHYGVNEEKAIIAGLLHDCGKKITKNDNLTHSRIGRNIAAEEFNIHDEEILNAIMYHTTGREDMTMLDKIIFIADKIEPTRDYENVEELRKVAYENIDEAIIMSLKSTIEYVKKRNLKLDEDSIKTLDYLRRNNARP